MHSINSSIIPEQIPKLIDNFQRPISYITLLDLSFFFLIIIAFSFVFCGLTFFSGNLRPSHYKKFWYFPNSVHSWIRFTPSAQPLYCSSCRQLICGFWIFRSTGWQCTVCGRTAHTRCLTVCNKFQCKSPCQPSPLHHQLVQGNLPSGCLCCICGLMCWSPFALLGLRCLWCNKTVHEECSSRLPENCDMGEFHNLVLSPTLVRLEFSSNSYFSTFQSLPSLLRAAKHCMPFSTVSSENRTPASLEKTLKNSGDTESRRVSYHHFTSTPFNKANRSCESIKNDSFYPLSSLSYLRSFAKSSRFFNNDKILPAYETKSHKTLRKKNSMISTTFSKTPLGERCKRFFHSNTCCCKDPVTPKLKKKNFNCIDTNSNLLRQDNDERFNDRMTELIHTIPVQANVWSICLDSNSKNILCSTKNICTLPSKANSISSTLTMSPLRESYQIEKFTHSQPLLVFVNSKSGGQFGLHLFKEFYRYLNPLQVIDIQSEGEPQRALNLFQPIAILGCLRILVCGGDGTVGWVIDEVQKIYGALPHGNVPVGILPLGTGNDLAHVLGWGHCFNGNLFHYLKRIEKANPQSLDLWNIRITPHGKNKPILNTTFNNYVDIGVIARIALNFHNLREAHPELFQSRLGNKFLYGEMGVREWVNEKNMNLNTMKLWCDGVPVFLSEKIQGLIVVNIPSFSGGLSLWNIDSQDESLSSGTSKYRSKLVCTSRQNPLFCTPLKSLRKKKRSSVAPFPVTGKTTLVYQKKMSFIQKIHILSSRRKQQKKKCHSYVNSIQHKNRLIQTKRYILKHQNRFHTHWKKQCMGDEIIEVVAVRSLFHLGQIQVGLAQPLHICQGRSLQIDVPVTVPLQINGEPRMVPACTIDIEYKEACSVLSPSDTFDNGVIATITEVLDSAVVNSIVTPVQRNTLYRELTKRFEE